MHLVDKDAIFGRYAKLKAVIPGTPSASEWRTGGGAGIGADGGKVDGRRIRNCLALAVGQRVYVTDCLVHDSHIHNHGIMKLK